jgi:predicted PurR-regulated permease PerM
MNINLDREKRIIFIFILIILAIIIALFYPYLNSIILSFTLWIIFNPVFNKILKIFKNKTFSAALMILIVFCIIFIPLFFIFLNLLKEVQQNILSGDFNFREFSSNRFYFLNQFNINIDIKNYLLKFLDKFISSLGNIFSGALETGFNIFLSLFILFYLFKDIDKFKEFTFKISPLSYKTTQKILDNLDITIKSIVYGFLVVAFIQGFLAAIGFYIFGVKGAIILGILAMFASLVPTFGTALITTPVAFYLFLRSDFIGGVGMLAWGFLVVGSIDNFIRPYLIGKKSKIASVFVLLSVLGGISVFGIMGFVLGPLIFSMLLALIEIYNNLKIQNNELVE